ncbi:MAG: cytochrome c [Caulobacteraceae bacterium]
MPRSPMPEARRGWGELARVWLLAWAVGGALAGAAALSVVELGLFDTTASEPHWPLVSWGAHRTFINSVKLRAGKIDRPVFTAAEIHAGFGEYEHDCVMCHGGPGVARAEFVRGMTPTPPFVIDSARRWTPAQLYWILGQGVKMSAMPGWRATRTNVQIWDLVAFLEALPSLTPRDYAGMRASAAANKDGLAATRTTSARAT